MRVAFIGRWFQGDSNDGHLRALAGLVDLTVYGVHARTDFCASRELDSVDLTRRVGPRLWFYRRLEDALDADKPDVVHVLTEPWQLLAFQVARWARRHPETALVVHNSDRNWWTVSAGARIARRSLASKALARADGFVSESNGGLREAERFGLVDQAVTALVHMNPKDPDVFRPPLDDVERAAAREQLGLPRNGTGVGFLGRLSPEKGPLLFLDAFHRAAPQVGESLWAAVAGTGPLAGEVGARAGSRVTCLGSLSYPAEVATFLRGIDTLVMPSIRTGRWEEQAPRALIEAMMSSCVVVGTPVGGIPEMVDSAGIVVSEAAASSLAEGIVQAASHPSASDLRKAARERAVEVYSGESVAKVLVDVWERALATRRGKPWSMEAPRAGSPERTVA
jgi:glycosyltransferase involved in cell wall biosynthesis